MLKYSLVSEGDGASLTVYKDGKVYTATSTHPNYDDIVAAVVTGDVDVSLFDVETGIVKKFERLSERVSYANGVIYFDGDPQDDICARQIVEAISEGSSYEPFVYFMEKVASNPNAHSREQLFGWMKKHSLTVDSDGDIIAYRGVRVDNEGNFTSTTQGPAVVDGVPVDGYVPNYIGAVVEMPRSMVQHNPAVGCDTGLHAANWRYASTMGSVRIKIKINPRDVVSVPTESNEEKMRVCRFTVLEQIDGPVTTKVDKAPQPKVESTKIDYEKTPLKVLRGFAQDRKIRVEGRRPSHCTKPELVKALKADDRKQARRKNK